MKHTQQLLSANINVVAFLQVAFLSSVWSPTLHKSFGGAGRKVCFPWFVIRTC